MRHVHAGMNLQEAIDAPAWHSEHFRMLVLATPPRAPGAGGRAAAGCDREMLGVPGRRVDRSCRFIPAWTWRNEQLRGPLILLVAAGRAPGHVRIAVAQRERGRERVRGRLPGASAAGWPSSSQNICARVPRQKPSSGMTATTAASHPMGSPTPCCRLDRRCRNARCRRDLANRPPSARLHPCRHRVARASWRRSFTTAPKPSTEPGRCSSEAWSVTSLRRASL